MSNSYWTKFVGVMALIAIWQVISSSGFVDELFFPSPFATARAVITLLPTSLWNDVLLTLTRTLAAFGIAAIIGVPLGLLLGRLENIYRAFEPVLDFFRSMPATALFPLFMLLFGIGDGSKIAAATFGALLSVTFNTAYGVIHAGKIRAYAAKLMGASRYQVFATITVWESLPQTFVGMRNAISLSLTIVVVTEMFVGTNVGLGRRIVDAQVVFDTPTMFAALLAAGALGYVLNATLLTLERRLVHWTRT